MKYFAYIVLVTVGLTLALSAGIFAIAHLALEQHLETAETSRMTDDCTSVRGILQTELDDVTMFCCEYAKQDETRSFILDPNNRTLEALMKTFRTAHQDAVMLYDPGGNLIYSASIERSNLTSRPVSPALRTYLEDHDLGAKVRSTGHGVAGFISLPEGPMMIAVTPVFTETGQRSAQGALIFGRYIGDEEAQRIQNITGLSVSFYSADDPAAFAGLADGDRTDLTGYPAIIPSADGNTLSGLLSINDPDGASAFFTRVDRPRNLHFKTTDSITLLLLLVVVGCASSICIPLVLDRRFFRRFETINSTMAAIRKDRDFSRHLVPGKAEEINTLTTSINTLLSVLEDCTAEKDRFEERFQDSLERYDLVFHSASDAIFVLEKGCISDCNKKARELLGRDPEDVNGHAFLEFSPEYQPDGRQSAVLFQEFYEQAWKGVDLHFEWRCLRKDGSPADVEFTLKPCHLKSGSYLLAVGRDTGAKKETERIKSEALARIEMNLEQFAGLNDEIRNPLQVIQAIAEMHPSEDTEIVLEQVGQIDKLVNDLDRGYIASDKVREFLKKHSRLEKSE